MAMTLRLPEELDSAAEKMAAERHASKHAIVVEAVRRMAAEEAKTTQVVELTQEIATQYAELFTRLEDA